MNIIYILSLTMRRPYSTINLYLKLQEWKISQRCVQCQIERLKNIYLYSISKSSNYEMYNYNIYIKQNKKQKNMYLISN